MANIIKELNKIKIKIYQELTRRLTHFYYFLVKLLKKYNLRIKRLN